MGTIYELFFLTFTNRKRSVFTPFLSFTHHGTLVPLLDGMKCNERKNTKIFFSLVDLVASRGQALDSSQ